jgi:hypothetical protein
MEGTMHSVRRYGLLYLQYMAQAKDAYDCLRESSSRAGSSNVGGSKAENDMVNDEFETRMNTNPQSLLELLQEKHPGYVQAGHKDAVERYHGLCKEFFALTTDVDKQNFLQKQTTLDLLRICLKKVFQESGHDPHSTHTAMQSLINETLHYFSLKIPDKIKSDIENYKPCRVTNISYNVMFDSEKIKPLSDTEKFGGTTSVPTKKNKVVSVDLSDE